MTIPAAGTLIVLAMQENEVQGDIAGVPRSIVSKFKKWAKSLGMILMVFVIAGALIGNNQKQAEEAKAKAIAIKQQLSLECFKIQDEDVAMKAGNVGTSERQIAVDAFYNKVLTSPCVIWGDGTILTNPFQGIKSDDSNISLFKLAYYQSLRDWNGIEPFARQVCADGWASPSIGKSGACSSHGGVATQFKGEIKYQLGSVLSRSGMRTIYLPNSNKNLLSEK